MRNISEATWSSSRLSDRSPRSLSKKEGKNKKEGEEGILAVGAEISQIDSILCPGDLTVGPRNVFTPLGSNVGGIDDEVPVFSTNGELFRLQRNSRWL